MCPRLFMDWIRKHLTARRIAFAAAYSSTGLFCLAALWGALSLISGEFATEMILLLVLAGVIMSCGLFVLTVGIRVAEAASDLFAPFLCGLNFGTTILGGAIGGAQGDLLGAGIGAAFGSVGVTCIIALVSHGLKALHRVIDRTFPPR